MDQPTRIASPQPDGASTADDTRPGVLRGGATLTLQSRQVQRLVKGRAAPRMPDSRPSSACSASPISCT